MAAKSVPWDLALCQGAFYAGFAQEGRRAAVELDPPQGNCHFGTWLTRGISPPRNISSKTLPAAAAQILEAPRERAGHHWLYTTVMAMAHADTFACRQATSDY